MDRKIVEACEQLFQRALKEGVWNAYAHNNRTGDGPYMGGWQKYVTYAMLQQNDTTIKATRTSWRIFNLNIDREGTSYHIEVFQGTERIFAARREGFMRTKSFTGSSERFASRSVMPETAWNMIPGTLPEPPLSAPV